VDLRGESYWACAEAEDEGGMLVEVERDGMCGREVLEAVERRGVSERGGGGWEELDVVADRLGILMFLSSRIESSSSSCMSVLGRAGKSRRESSLGKRSLGSSALLMGRFSTASVNRLYS